MTEAMIGGDWVVINDEQVVGSRLYPLQHAAAIAAVFECATLGGRETFVRNVLTLERREIESFDTEFLHRGLQLYVGAMTGNPMFENSVASPLPYARLLMRDLSRKMRFDRKEDRERPECRICTNSTKAPQ